MGERPGGFPPSVPAHEGIGNPLKKKKRFMSESKKAGATNSSPYMTDAAGAFREALLSSDEEGARRIYEKAAGAYSPLEFVEAVVVPALDDIGTGWADNRYALSQVYMSGRICENIVDAALPPGGRIRESVPETGIALLRDYHALGKRIVCATLRAGGYPLRDYGRVDTGELVEQVAKDPPDILMISVLMLSSAMEVANVVRRLRSRGVRVRVAVGGAPFRLDRNLWRVVGADIAGATASDALSIVRAFSREASP